MKQPQESQLILKLHNEWCNINGYSVKKNKGTPTHNLSRVSTAKFRSEIIKSCKRI